MLITKFNKMIRNRILWWFIGGIVIITFVGWFSPQGGCEPMPQASSSGTLNGVPVTDAELRQARFNTYLSLCLMVGRIIPMTEDVDTELNDQAWKRVAALRDARKMGLGATEDEVLNLIKRDPQFAENGVFSKGRYEAFTRNALGALNCSVTQFEQQLAENIILQKLQNLTAAAAWISPTDMQRLVARYADSFDVQYVTLGTNQPAGDIVLTDDDLRRYFDANTNLFVIPDKVSVKYVQYPVSNYLVRATVDQTAIEEYYDTHAEEFTTVETNGTKTVAPLAKVQAVISNTLVRASAFDQARNAASDFVLALAPARDGSATPFDTAAAGTGLTVRLTGLFDAVSGPAELDAGAAFIEAAFRLRPTPDEYFSDAVPGEDRVFVLGLITNTEARVPEFAEVKGKVVAPAREQARIDRLAKKAADLRGRLETALKGGKNFKTAAQAEGLNVSTTAVFSVYSVPDALNAGPILEDITSRGAGELTAVLEGTNGLVIAYVADRKIATMDETATVKAQMGANIVRRRARTLFSEYQDALIRTGKKEATETAAPARDYQPPIVD